MIDVMNEIREGMLQEILYTDELVLIAEKTEKLHKKVILGKVHMIVKA